jgi:peptidoglycan hydrolase CwlO-like protein
VIRFNGDRTVVVRANELFGGPGGIAVNLPETALAPEEEELEHKNAKLVALEAQLADRELELAGCLADLNHFEKRYLQTVGRRYAQLDELKAKIAEARARENPRSQDAREQARQARTQAQESARAMGDERPDAASPDGAASRPQPYRSESLNKLYRQAAKLLHPDLTLDGDEKAKRHRLMAEVNAAYARGDEAKIRAILRDWHASPESVQGDGPGAELVRVIRKIAQVEKRLKAIAAELDRLRHGELFKLKQQVEDARANGRDLLKELGERLDREIARAREELNRVTSLRTP